MYWKHAKLHRCMCSWNVAKQIMSDILLDSCQNSCNTFVIAHDSYSEFIVAYQGTLANGTFHVFLPTFL